MPDTRSPLLSLDEALARLAAGAAAARIADTEMVSTFDALGRVLAADVISAIDVPPADNSSMDGYVLLQVQHHYHQTHLIFHLYYSTHHFYYNLSKQQNH